MKNKKLNHSALSKEWVLKAKDDELNAVSILKHRDGTASVVCFLSQQMAEKYLKAFLTFRGERFPKIHILDFLLELCLKLDSGFIKLKDDAIFLTDFYVETRYPGDYPEFNWKDGEKAFKAALRIKDFISGILFQA